MDWQQSEEGYREEVTQKTQLYSEIETNFKSISPNDSVATLRMNQWPIVLLLLLERQQLTRRTMG